MTHSFQPGQPAERTAVPLRAVVVGYRSYIAIAEWIADGGTYCRSL